MRRALGPWNAIVRGDGDNAVVLFHGYGADGADLSPLADETRTARPWRWVFPDAPLELDYGGRAWFPIDEGSIQRAQMTGKAVDWSGLEPAGAEELREKAFAFLAALGVPWDRLVLGGFSQGAILAVDLALRAPVPPRGLAILSGNLVSAASWRALARSRAGLPFFQSHGIADPILGFQGARRLEALLREAGLRGSLLSFEGGHGIPPEVVQALARFLDAA